MTKNSIKYQIQLILEVLLGPVLTVTQVQRLIWIKGNNATTHFFCSCICACILVRSTIREMYEFYYIELVYVLAFKWEPPLQGGTCFVVLLARVQVFKYSNSVYWGVDACSGCPTSTLPSAVLLNGGLFTAHCSRLSSHALSDSFSPLHCTTMFSWALHAIKYIKLKL